MGPPLKKCVGPPVTKSGPGPLLCLTNANITASKNQMISEVGIGEDVLKTWIGIYETKLGGIIVNIMNSNR